MIDADVALRLSALETAAPFRLLDASERLLIARHARLRRYGAGDVLLPAGAVADLLFVTVTGAALLDGRPAPAVFDGPGLLFGLGAAGAYVAGEAGLQAVVIAKPHVFTIARECPEFVLGLRDLDAAR